MTPKSERVPLSLVMIYVEDWISDWYGAPLSSGVSKTEDGYLTLDSIKRDHPEWDKPDTNLAVLVLADKSGLHPRSINQWLRQYKGGSTGSVSFWDADALFTGMGNPGLWFRDPELRELRAKFEEA